MPVSSSAYASGTEGISLMRYFISGIAATLLAGTEIAAIMWFVVFPRLDWGAGRRPGAIEQRMAISILERWIRRNTNHSTNPLPPTPENLKAARTEYEEHCAVCHGLDGSGCNRFEVDFYPPVANLIAEVQMFSDSEIYFIVAEGIRNTAMPAFRKTHSPEDIWRTVLWVRHLVSLTPGEKAEIEKEVQHATMEHEITMEPGTNIQPGQ